MSDVPDAVFLEADPIFEDAHRAASEARFVLDRLTSTNQWVGEDAEVARAADSAIQLAQGVLEFPASVPGRRTDANLPDDFAALFRDWLRVVGAPGAVELAEFLRSFDQFFGNPGELRGAVVELLRLVDHATTDMVGTMGRTSMEAVEGSTGAIDWLRERGSEARTARRILELTGRLERVTEQSVLDAAEIGERRVATAEAAGVVAEGSLAIEFATIARAERRPALIFQGLTIALFVGTIAYAAAVAYESREPSVELAQRLSVAIPVLLLAGYFSRESTRHRRAQRWATVLTAQLRTINAYTAQLDDANAAVLRQSFGQRVFMSSPDGVESASDDSDATGSLLAGSADLARAIRGTPP
jgi:hypothetical protein